MSARTACIQRDTRETQIEIEVDLDGSGCAELETGLPFLEHMLDQVARHGMLDLKIKAQGDLSVDAHHTVEDIGIVLGQAIQQALGDKKSIRRYGHAYVPLDEALSRVVIDFSGRPGLNYQVEYPRARIQDFDVDLVHEFFQGFTNHAMATLHVDGLRGNNAHHVAETVFKAFGRAVRMAVEQDPRETGTPLDQRRAIAKIRLILRCKPSLSLISVSAICAPCTTRCAVWRDPMWTFGSRPSPRS